MNKEQIERLKALVMEYDREYITWDSNYLFIEGGKFRKHLKKEGADISDREKIKKFRLELEDITKLKECVESLSRMFEIYLKLEEGFRAYNKEKSRFSFNFWPFNRSKSKKEAQAEPAKKASQPSINQADKDRELKIIEELLKLLEENNNYEFAKKIAADSSSNFHRLVKLGLKTILENLAMLNKKIKDLEEKAKRDKKLKKELKEIQKQYKILISAQKEYYKKYKLEKFRKVLIEEDKLNPDEADDVFKYMSNSEKNKVITDCKKVLITIFTTYLELEEELETI